MHLTPQKSLLPLETMSQLAEPVIPESAAVGLGRDDELRHSVMRGEGTCSILRR